MYTYNIKFNTEGTIMQVILSLNSTTNYMNCGKDSHPATTLIVKSATLAQAQSADKTCDGMAKDYYRNFAGGGGEGAAVNIYFLMNLLVLVM